MLNFVMRKLASTLVVMLVVAVIVFLLIHLSPGDPAAVIAGDRANVDDVQVLDIARDQYALRSDQLSCLKFFH